MQVNSGDTRTEAERLRALLTSPPDPRKRELLIAAGKKAPEDDAHAALMAIARALVAHACQDWPAVVKDLSPHLTHLRTHEPDTVLVGRALSTLGCAERGMGRYTSAQALLNEALRRMPPQPSAPLARIHDNIGLIMANLHRYEDALRSFQHARAIGQKAGMPPEAFITHITSALHELGRHDEEADLLRVQLHHLESGDRARYPGQRAFPLAGLARIARLQGRPEEGLPLIDAAIEIVEASPNRALPQFLKIRARLRRATGDRRGAIEDLERTVSLSSKMWSPRWTAEALKELSAICEEDGDYRAALDAHQRYTRIELDRMKALGEQRLTALREEAEVVEAERIAALEKLRREEQAHLNAALEELHQFHAAAAAAAAHDIRGSLTPLALLPHQTPMPEDTRAAFARSTRRIRSLVADLLDVFCLELPGYRPSRAAVDVAALWASVSAEVAPELEADGLTLLAEGSGTVQADAALLERVLLNLVRNAIRHSPPGGTIRLAADGAQLSVSDQGPGVPDHLRDQLFQPGYSDRPSRARVGLGLYFCRLAVRAHGGQIGVDDAPGGGARFWIRLSE